MTAWCLTAITLWGRATPELLGRGAACGRRDHGVAGFRGGPPAARARESGAASANAGAAGPLQVAVARLRGELGIAEIGQAGSCMGTRTPEPREKAEGLAWLALRRTLAGSPRWSRGRGPWTDTGWRERRNAGSGCRLPAGLAGRRMASGHTRR